MQKMLVSCLENFTHNLSNTIILEDFISQKLFSLLAKTAVGVGKYYYALILYGAPCTDSLGYCSQLHGDR